MDENLNYQYHCKNHHSYNGFWYNNISLLRYVFLIHKTIRDNGLNNELFFCIKDNINNSNLIGFLDDHYECDVCIVDDNFWGYELDE